MSGLRSILPHLSLDFLPGAASCCLKESLDYFLKKKKKERKKKKNKMNKEKKNKAGYTATEVACGWAGTIV